MKNNTKLKKLLEENDQPAGKLSCSCQGVDTGSYNNQVTLVPPPHMAAYKKKQGGAPTICVDTCIADEILNLWSMGITTTGCCCGHNKTRPYIGVIESDIPRMKSMGYTVCPNPCRPDGEDSFYPKSIAL
jgi:hypothetical protein